MANVGPSFDWLVLAAIVERFLDPLGAPTRHCCHGTDGQCSNGLRHH